MSTKRRVNYFLTCEEVSFDEASRNVSLLRLFDAVGDVNLPVVPANFVIVFSVHAEDKDISDGIIGFRIELDGPKGESLLKAEGKAKMEPGKHGLITHLDLSGRIKFTTKGTHNIRLYLNDEQTELDTIQFEVLIGNREDYAK